MILSLILLAVTPGVSPPFNRCGARYGEAAAQLRVAAGAGRRGDWTGANRALDTGLDRLGHAYAPAEAADDTGLGLVLAKARQRDGKPRLAAEGKRRILASRLDLCTVASQRIER